MDPLSKPLKFFKSYDIRGRVGADVGPENFNRVARAFAQASGARCVVVGRDARASSPGLLDAVCAGLTAQGVEVLDLGLCGTEEVYCATASSGSDGGICVTASHNPIEYNGLKIVGPGSRPLGTTPSLRDIKTLAERGGFAPTPRPGRRHVRRDLRSNYLAKILSCARIERHKPLKILFNAGNGAAGPTLDALLAELRAHGSPWEFATLNTTPDPEFPFGIPNPTDPKQQALMGDAVRASGADFGVAWDGDFDRCVLFDHLGALVPTEQVIGLLAAHMLDRAPGSAIIHDTRVIWNIEDVVARHNGRSVQSKCGHSHMKAALRDHNAIYGGEHSGHHYFRDFFFCDSGMIPWILVAEELSVHARGLRDLLAERGEKFPTSGEQSFEVQDPKGAIDRVFDALSPRAQDIDWIDGLSLSFDTCRINLRASKTEPVMRLNGEARGAGTMLETYLEMVRKLCCE